MICKIPKRKSRESIHLSWRTVQISLTSNSIYRLFTQAWELSVLKVFLFPAKISLLLFKKFHRNFFCITFSLSCGLLSFFFSFFFFFGGLLSWRTHWFFFSGAISFSLRVQGKHIYGEGGNEKYICLKYLQESSLSRILIVRARMQNFKRKKMKVSCSIWSLTT